MENHEEQKHPDRTAVPVQDELCRLILNHTEQSILLINKELLILEANDFAKKTVKELLGIDITIGMDLLVLADKNRIETLRSLYAEVFKGAHKTTIKEFNTGNEIIVFEIDIRPVYNSSGHISGSLITGKDITEKTRSEAQLKEAEERWRFALEGGNQGAWDWNLKTGEVYYSASYKRLYGYTDEDPLYSISDWKENIHPEDRHKVETALTEHLTSTNPFYDTRYRIKNKEGNYIWIWARGMVMGKDENGQPLRMIGTHTDITEQVNAEQHYRTLFKHNPLPCWIYESCTGKFLEVNEAAVSQYGFSEEEFLSSSLYLTHPSSQHQKLKERLSAESSMNTQSFNNWIHQKKNGEIIFVDLRINSINYKGTDAKLVVAHDVTNKVQVENELRKSNERFELASQATLEALWEWNIETDELYLSPVYEEMFGYTIDVNRKYHQWHEHIHPEDLEEVTHSFYDAIASPGVTNWQKEYRYLKADNSFIYVIDHCIIIRNEKGKAIKVVGAYQDISVRKNAEQELIRSNERFLYAAKASSEALWEWDFITGQFFASQAYTDIFGWQVNEQRTFDEWHDYIHPADREETIRSYYSSLDNPGVTQWKKEYRYLKATGSYANVIDKASILRDKEGKPVKVIGAIQDITEQKETEEELRKSNERYKYVLVATSDVVWDWDIQKNMILWSDNYTKNFGWHLPHDKMMRDDSCNVKFHPEDRERVMRSLSNIVADPTQTLWHEEMRYLKSDGQYAYVSDRGYVIRNENGEAIRMIGAMKDITSQKKAEENIRKSNERFQLVNHATSDAIYDWDLVTKELYWGEGIQTLFGFVPSEVSFQRWSELVHLADKERVLQSLTRTIDDPLSHLWKEEYRFKKADGHYSYVLERGFIIRDENGKALRIIGSVQDYTERHYQEQLLSLEKTIFELSTNPKLEFRNIVLTLLKGIEDMHEDAYTSVMLHNEDENCLVPFAALRLPESYLESLRGIKIGPEEGSCGPAIVTKERIIVEDIETSPLWEKYKSLATAYGLKACWSFPIIHSSGNVMGNFAIYYKNQKGPSVTELNTFERVKSIIRVLMENKWSLDRIKEAKERFDIMMRATHDLIWDWDLEKNSIYRDQLGLQKVYGINNTNSIRHFPRWLQRIHPQDRERVALVINEILHSKKQNHFDVEYRFLRDDKTYSYVYDRGIIVRNNEGKPIRMIGAAQDVTERKRLEHELLQNELEKQKAINQATVDTQEAERSEIGKELHDNVNQVLTTTKLYLDLALSSPEMKDELIVKSNKNIINVINEIRQLSRSLMDPSIGDLGLIDSIYDLVENINLTRKLHVKLHSDADMETLLDQNHKLTVFRIIQETLNNAMRHAKATAVSISFTRIQNQIEISIEDNGIGFDLAMIKKGAGLKNIQNRIYLINGTHTIQTAPGKGCRITIGFPIIKQPLEITN